MKIPLSRSIFILLLFPFPLSAMAEEPAPGDWPSYGRDADASRYSPLTQIDKSNVARLERAWTFHTGDILTNEKDVGKNVFECTPLAVEGKLFILTSFCRLLALEPATGEEIWSFDPEMDPLRAGGVLASRGAAYWKKGGESRILVPVRDGRLYSIDAKTGRPDPAFGEEGAVNLRDVFGPPRRRLNLSSPPAIYGDLVIQGCMVPDTTGKVMPVPLVALSILTGEVVWTFNTVPVGGEFGTETWENESWRDRAGNNVWSMMSVDEERGMLFIPVSTPNFDFWGGDRTGENLFSDAVVALDAATGRRIWHYQTVHHDLWNYDLPAQPNLIDLTIDGEEVPVVAQLGKTGFVYVLNRLTGEPIYPIEERPVPASDVPGEVAWPTQPYPANPPPFSRQGLTEKGLSRLDDETHAYVLKEFRKYRSEGMFTPPSLRGSIVMPGFHGGGAWSGAAFDPATGRIFISSSQRAFIIKLVENEREGAVPYRHTGLIPFLDQNGYPGNAPPWGQLTALDLNRNEIVWQVPLGEYEELTAKGIPPTGMGNFGGATVTAGGLVFIASTMDEYIRAFDADTGEVLWKAQLDAAGYAAPVSLLAPDGKQYIVICAGGGGMLKTRPGDSVIAFTLP